MTDILTEAASLINGERAQQYGDATECFGRIAALWSALLDIVITPNDVANMMILLKVARTRDTYHRDSYVDIAGYAALVEQINNLGPFTKVVPREWDSLLDVPAGVSVVDKDGDHWSDADVSDEKEIGRELRKYAPFVEVLYG